MSDEYEIIITQKAEDDFTQIYFHLAYVLLRPDLANNVKEKIQNKINGLSYMPYRFREYGIDDLRIALVPFYKIIYSVSEIEKKVFIVRIIYSLSDDTNPIC